MSTSNAPAPAYTSHKLLVANRGEIAVRILRTAKRLNVATVAVYTRPDATAPHVILADEAVALRAHDEDPVSNAAGYLDAEAIVTVCKDRGVTLVHPGYGFLSENASFAQMVVDAGIGWLGPRPGTIEAMGLKHRARELAREVDVPLVPGSQGLLRDVDDAVALASEIGLPVMLKSTAGGGGMGLVVCNSVEELREKFESTQARAQVSVSSLPSLPPVSNMYDNLCRHCFTTTAFSSSGTTRVHGTLKCRCVFGISYDFD